MFTPTHLLVSRTKQTPVQLAANHQGYDLYTEQEWQTGRKPAFQMHPKLGIFCQGVQIVGYQLQPLPATVTTSTPAEATA